MSAVAVIGLAQAPAVEQARHIADNRASVTSQFATVTGIATLHEQLSSARKAADDRRIAVERASRSGQRDPRGAARTIAAAQYGWTGGQWSCLDQLWDHESDWNYRAVNPTSGAYGIPQSLPASKMAAAGSDWRTNAVTQIRWGLRYIDARYDTPCSAWRFWQRHHWY